MNEKEIIPRNHGVLMWNRDEVEYTKEQFEEAMLKLCKLRTNRPKLAVELATYRKYVPVLMKKCDLISEMNSSLKKQIDRYGTDSEEKKHKRWSEEEDLLLIEMACSDMSLLEVSTTMGRTPSSIKTRLSKLVGVKRISSEIAGRFIGTVNGEQTEGVLKGTLYKGETA